MAKCHVCGAETDLREAGVPVCPKCVDEPQSKKHCPEKRNPPEEGDAEKCR